MTRADKLAQVLAEHTGTRFGWTTNPEKYVVHRCICGQWETAVEDGAREAHAAHVAAVVLAHLTAEGWIEAESVRPMIRDLVDPDECWFDHHGGCQAHGYLSLEPGDVCPQREAKDWLRAHEPVEGEQP